MDFRTPPKRHAPEPDDDRLACRHCEVLVPRGTESCPACGHEPFAGKHACRCATCRPPEPPTRRPSGATDAILRAERKLARIRRREAVEAFRQAAIITAMGNLVRDYPHGARTNETDIHDLARHSVAIADALVRAAYPKESR